MASSRPIHRPRQARSRASLERLLGAARELLATRSFDETTVAEISARAGLTVGAFYSRFPDKEALLRHLEDQLYEDMRAVVVRLEQRVGEGLAAPAAIVRALIAALVATYLDHRPVARALMLRSRTDPALVRRIVEFNRDNIGRVERLLLATRAIQHPKPELALEFALYAQRSVLREALLFEEGWSKERVWTPKRLVDETTRLVVRYLGLPEPA